MTFRKRGEVENPSLATMILTLGVSLLGAAGCSGRADQADCGPDDPCPTRGDLCDEVQGICTPNDEDLNATEDASPASFADKPIAFFRGQLCLPLEVQSGQQFPISLNPCLHPCVTRTNHRFKFGWNCSGSRCEAWALNWIVGSGTDCPADAFGRFDPTQCRYDTPVEFTINPKYSDGEPIIGTMAIDVPFLKNDDVAQIEAAQNDMALIEEIIARYPWLADRTPDERSVVLDPSSPAPPTTCADGGCDCFDIGFESVP